MFGSDESLSVMSMGRTTDFSIVTVVVSLFASNSHYKASSKHRKLQFLWGGGGGRHAIGASIRASPASALATTKKIPPPLPKFISYIEPGSLCDNTLKNSSGNVTLFVVQYGNVHTLYL